MYMLPWLSPRSVQIQFFTLHESGNCFIWIMTQFPDSGSRSHSFVWCERNCNLYGSIQHGSIHRFRYADVSFHRAILPGVRYCGQVQTSSALFVVNFDNFGISHKCDIILAVNFENVFPNINSANERSALDNLDRCTSWFPSVAATFSTDPRSSWLLNWS